MIWQLWQLGEREGAAGVLFPPLPRPLLLQQSRESPCSVMQSGGTGLRGDLHDWADVPLPWGPPLSSMCAEACSFVSSFF